MADLTVTAAQVAPLYSDYGLVEIFDCIATATITAGQAVYQLSTGKVGLADANDSGKEQFRGIALKGAGAGQAVSVLKRGPMFGYDLSGVAYDGIVYLSNTAGALADAAGTMTVRVGRVVALTDNALTKVLYVDADWRSNWA